MADDVHTPSAPLYKGDCMTLASTSQMYRRLKPTVTVAIPWVISAWLEVVRDLDRLITA